MSISVWRTSTRRRRSTRSSRHWRSHRRMGPEVGRPIGFANVLDRCLAVRAGEQVLLLTDPGSDLTVVDALVEGIEERRGVPVVSRIPTPELPGSEPPATVAAAMLEASAVIELTSLFIGSSVARREATSAGVRYLAMPGVRMETFRDDGPLFMGPGPLPSPVVLHIDGGELKAVEGEEAGRLEDMLARCADERMTNLAEVSMAFNPSGRVCGVAMETESARGTAHIALGNSIAYGGIVDAVAHLDCVMKEATLELDGRPVMVAGDLV